MCQKYGKFENCLVCVLLVKKHMMVGRKTYCEFGTAIRQHIRYTLCNRWFLGYVLHKDHCEQALTL